MTYFIVLIGASLLLSGLFLAIAHRQGWRRAPTFLVACAIVPIIFLGIGLYFLSPDAVPTPAEAVAITEGRIADRGPSNFLLGMAFGIVPGVIYLIVSTLMFFVVHSFKSK